MPVLSLLEMGYEVFVCVDVIVESCQLHHFSDWCNYNCKMAMKNLLSQ